MSKHALITYRGRTQTLTAWAEEKNMPRSTLGMRFKNGWSTTRAMTTPLGKMRRKRGPAQIVPAQFTDMRMHHMAMEHMMMGLIHRYFASYVAQSIAMDADIRNLGLPPEGTFKAPGVVNDFAEKPSDRSLSVVRDLT